MINTCHQLIYRLNGFMVSSIRENDCFDTEHLQADVKNRAIRGAGATIFASALSFVIHFFSTIILARLLTPDDFGLIAMVTAFSLLLQNFGVNGFTEAIIQKESLSHKMMSTLFWTNAVTSFSLNIVFILMTPLIVWFYKEPHLYAITIGISLSIIAGGMSTVHMAILRRNMQFYVTAGISILTMLVSTLTAIVMALLGLGYWALVANTVLQPLTVAVCAWLFCRWRPGMPDNINDVLPMIKFAMHTYGNFALNYFSRNIDKLLTGWRYGAQSLGYYKKAYDLFALPANQLIAPISNVALAALSRLTNEPDKYRHYYLNAITIIAFMGMPLSAVLTLSGNDIILLVLGPQWIRAGEVFSYFGASIGIMLIYGTQGWLHLSLGHPERWVRWSFFETIITTFFFIIGMLFGIEGIAIAYTTSFYILVCPCLSFAGKPINLNIYSIINAIWKYFIAALIAGCVSYIVLYETNNVSVVFYKFNTLIRIVISSVMCVGFYLISIIILFWSLMPVKTFLSTAYQMLPLKKAK